MPPEFAQIEMPAFLFVNAELRVVCVHEALYIPLTPIFCRVEYELLTLTFTFFCTYLVTLVQTLLTLDATLLYIRFAPLIRDLNKCPSGSKRFAGLFPQYRYIFASMLTPETYLSALINLLISGS